MRGSRLSASKRFWEEFVENFANLAIFFQSSNSPTFNKITPFVSLIDILTLLFNRLHRTLQKAR
jgi:hypothetical protein